jgi:hypothetical protein
MYRARLLGHVQSSALSWPNDSTPTPRVKKLNLFKCCALTPMAHSNISNDMGTVPGFSPRVLLDAILFQLWSRRLSIRLVG